MIEGTETSDGCNERADKEVRPTPISSTFFRGWVVVEVLEPIMTGLEGNCRWVYG